MTDIIGIDKNIKNIYNEHNMGSCVILVQVFISIPTTLQPSSHYGSWQDVLTTCLLSGKSQWPTVSPSQSTCQSRWDQTKAFLPHMFQEKQHKKKCLLADDSQDARKLDVFNLRTVFLLQRFDESYKMLASITWKNSSFAKNCPS